MRVALISCPQGLCTSLHVPSRGAVYIKATNTHHLSLRHYLYISHRSTRPEPQAEMSVRSGIDADDSYVSEGESSYSPSVRGGAGQAQPSAGDPRMMQRSATRTASHQPSNILRGHSQAQRPVHDPSGRASVPPGTRAAPSSRPETSSYADPHGRRSRRQSRRFETHASGSAGSSGGGGPDGEDQQSLVKGSKARSTILYMAGPLSPSGPKRAPEKVNILEYFANQRMSSSAHKPGRT